MILRFPALYRFLGLAAVVSGPAVLIACASDVTSTGDGAPSPSSSSTETTDPPPTAPTTAPTSTAPAEKDAGTDARDAAPPPTDVAGSAECTAYCAKMQSQCGKTCTPKSDCAVAKGQCAESTRAFLDCQTTKGQWYCGGDGFSIVHSCKRDTSLCN